MSRAYPAEPPPVVPPLYIHCPTSAAYNSDSNLSTSPTSLTQQQPIIDIAKPSILNKSIKSSLPSSVHKPKRHQEKYWRNKIKSKEEEISLDPVNVPVPSLNRPRLDETKQHLSCNGYAANEEACQHNLPGEVYITHHHNTEIRFKIVNNCYPDTQRISNVGDDDPARTHQKQVDNRFLQPEEIINQMPEKDYHSINLPLSEVSVKEVQRNEEGIMSHIDNSVTKLEESDIGDRSHASLPNDNPILVQSSDLIGNQEMRVKKSPSPVERAFSAPVVSSGDLHKEDTDKSEIETGLNCKNGTHLYISVGVQVSPSPQYRLRFLPICGCSRDESEWEFCHPRFFFRLIGRWAFSQCGLGILLFLWALLGAAAFRNTEGPREEEQTRELRTMQEELIVNLATELKRVTLGALDSATVSNVDVANQERETMKTYVAKHEELLLRAVGSGYGEGGGGGKIWNYAGCVLFAVSLLTTLGFGAPVPRTTLGRIAAVIFSAVGIPLHLLLVLNIGMLVAVKLQGLATKWQHGTSFCDAFFQCCCHYNGKKPHCSPQDIHPTEANCVRQVDNGNGNHTRETNIHFHPPFSPPCWLKWFPAVAIALYYTMGVLIFGAGRERPLSACLLFPLDFTAAGGVGRTSSTIRTCYAIYLEGAVTLAAISVSVLQVSASRGLVNLGLKLGLLTNS